MLSRGQSQNRGNDQETKGKNPAPLWLSKMLKSIDVLEDYLTKNNIQLQNKE